MAQYDLTPKMAAFLDPQFVHLILKFLKTQNIYPADELASLDLQALNSTLLISELKAAGASNLSEKEAEASKVNENSSAHGLYAAGRYEEALKKLESSPTNQSVWGRYAANIMAENYEAAAALAPALQEAVEASAQTSGTKQHLAGLNARAWLLHWILFSLFQTEQGPEKLIEIMFTSQYMSTLQAACPWMLRYLAVAVITTTGTNSKFTLHNRRVKDLVRAISQELYEYADPVVNFIAGVSVRYDDCQKLGEQLRLAIQVIEHDYFIHSYADKFAKAGRKMIFDLYTRSHDQFDASILSKALNLTQDQLEELLSVEDAQPVDSSKNIYKVSHSRSPVAQQVREKTKSLEWRAEQALSQARAKVEAA